MAKKKKAKKKTVRRGVKLAIPFGSIKTTATKKKAKKK